MKGKLFEFNPETKDWHERGIGMFKLNKSKKTEKYRISNIVIFFSFIFFSYAHRWCPKSSIKLEFVSQDDL